MLGLPGLLGRLGIQCLPATCSRKAPQNSISRNLRDVPVSTSCPLPARLCTWGWGWGPRQGHRPARSCWLAPSGSCRASPFCYLNSPSSPADNVDDPTGNFRGGPLTGWRVFLLLLCALLGIVVCAVVGAVVFQKRQDRNKRFY